MPGNTLLLHPDYGESESVLWEKRAARAAPSRVHLWVQLVHPVTGYVNPNKYEALLDTGAERTIIPFRAVEHFQQWGQAQLVKRNPGRFRLADGTLRDDVPSVEVAFQFIGSRDHLANDPTGLGYSEGRTGVRAAPIPWKRGNRWHAHTCFAWIPTLANPTSLPPSLKPTRRFWWPFAPGAGGAPALPKSQSSDELEREDPESSPLRVIIGMDIMQYWHVVLDGPERRYTVTLFHEPSPGAS